MAAIVQICVALGAIATVATWLIKTYFSPAAKARRRALKEGKQAVDERDRSKITAFFARMKRRGP